MSDSNNVLDLLSLKGKTALITGATGYLGSAMACALAEAGASVVVSSRKIAQARRAAEQLPRVGATHHAVAIDHMDEQSIETGFKEAIAQAGTINLLVNNGHEHLASEWRNVT